MDPGPRPATFGLPESFVFQLFLNFTKVCSTVVQLAEPGESYFFNLCATFMAFRKLLSQLSGRDDPPTQTFCYDRSVLRFSFACGLRPHAKLNPRTPLA